MQSALQWREVGMHQRQAENSIGRQASNATHCNTLRGSATHCNTVQHSATHCNTVQGSARLCNILQPIATQCNTVQHSATQCNTWQGSARQRTARRRAGGSSAIDRVTRRGNPNTVAAHCCSNSQLCPGQNCIRFALGTWRISGI